MTSEEGQCSYRATLGHDIAPFEPSEITGFLAFTSTLTLTSILTLLHPNCLSGGLAYFNFNFNNRTHEKVFIILNIL